MCFHHPFPRLWSFEGSGGEEEAPPPRAGRGDAAPGRSLGSASPPHHGSEGAQSLPAGGKSTPKNLGVWGGGGSGPHNRTGLPFWGGGVTQTLAPSPAPLSPWREAGRGSSSQPSLTWTPSLLQGQVHFRHRRIWSSCCWRIFLISSTTLWPPYRLHMTLTVTL